MFFLHLDFDFKRYLILMNWNEFLLKSPCIKNSILKGKFVLQEPHLTYVGTNIFKEGVDITPHFYITSTTINFWMKPNNKWIKLSALVNEFLHFEAVSLYFVWCERRCMKYSNEIHQFFVPSHLMSFYLRENTGLKKKSCFISFKSPKFDSRYNNWWWYWWENSVKFLFSHLTIRKYI